MSRHVELLHPNGDVFLQLRNVKPASGRPVSGWVVNGGWQWDVEGSEEVARDEAGYIRNRWQAEPWEYREA